MTKSPFKTPPKGPGAVDLFANLRACERREKLRVATRAAAIVGAFAAVATFWVWVAVRVLPSTCGGPWL